MEPFLNRLLADPVAQAGLRDLLELAMRHFYAFTLVVVRMSGLMIVGPLFGQPIVPPNVRILLVLSMSFLITPALNQRFPPGIGRLEIPPSLLDYGWIVAGEFGLGLVLGLGVLTVLSGLQLAGELIDQQTGIALGDIANPGMGMSASITGQSLFLLGTTLFLVIAPLNGHLQMIAALVGTFETLPVGEAFVSVSAIDFLIALVHESLILGVQVAAPILATMSLVALTMGYLGHTVPQVNVLVIGFAIRATLNLLILALSLSGAAKMIVDALPRTIDELQHVLTGLPM